MRTEWRAQKSSSRWRMSTLEAAAIASRPLAGPRRRPAPRRRRVKWTTFSASLEVTARSSDLLHRPDSGRWEISSLLFEVPDDILDDLMELRIELHRVVSMDSRNQIRTLAEISRILLAPFDPLQVSIALLHSCTSSMACPTCLSW